MKRRKERRYAIALFMLPILILSSLVVYQYFFAGKNALGTLVITAETSDKYYEAKQLNVQFTAVGTTPGTGASGTYTGTTPYNITVPAGTYTITFQSMKGFYEPEQRTVTVLSGRTAYVIEIYMPIPKVISVSSTGFNVTTVSAIHDITPVVWINTSSSFVVLLGYGFNRTIIAPGSNFTYVYSRAGSYYFRIFNTNYNGTVNVS